MTEPTSTENKPVYRNFPRTLGLLISAGSIFSFLVLLALDLMAPAENPYLGIFAYLLAPCCLALGLFLLAVGVVMQRRWLKRHGGGPLPPLVLIDLSQPRALRRFLAALAGGGIFLALVSIMSYRAYHFSESVEFCGQACHVAMEPEATAYPQGAHARVSCTACHIGPGAEWFVKAKVNGLHQVYAVWFNKYDRPIKTPINNLRPAQDICEKCHWPEKFTGDLDRVYAHYLSDSNNTPFTVRLSLKVGGSDSTHGPVGGIHWHMNVGNRVEYIATDERRQVIPWVRVTNRQGVVTEYRTAKFKPDPAKDVIRTMDCIDCHNRPAHIFHSPNDAVDLALSLGKLDATMPFVKKNAMQVLTQKYATAEEAQQKIATTLAATYGQDPRCKNLIAVVQKIYRDNFFPLMKTDWKTHANNQGHKESLGCFRCHDGEHKTADGKKSVKASNCSACHVLLAQGRGEQLLKLNAQGKPFEHPGGDIDETKCSDCHTGGLQ
jgi:hypothetical protein